MIVVSPSSDEIKFHGVGVTLRHMTAVKLACKAGALLRICQVGWMHGTSRPHVAATIVDEFDRVTLVDRDVGWTKTGIGIGDRNCFGYGYAYANGC